MNHEELKQFANACGTPAYLFDMRMVKDRISMMKAILPVKILFPFTDIRNSSFPVFLQNKLENHPEFPTRH